MVVVVLAVDDTAAGDDALEEEEEAKMPIADDVFFVVLTFFLGVAFLAGVWADRLGGTTVEDCVSVNGDGGLTKTLVEEEGFFLTDPVSTA